MNKITENETDWFGVKLLHKITISGMPKKTNWMSFIMIFMNSLKKVLFW